MTPPFETDRGARVHRNPWILGLAALPFFALLVLGVIAIRSGAPQPMFLTPHMLILGTVFSVLAWQRNFFHIERPGKLLADAKGVWFEGRLIAQRDQIDSGFVLPRPDGKLFVRLRRKGARLPVEVRVADREEGRGLLRALGLDASQSVAQFRLPSSAFADPAARKKFMVRFGVVLGGLAFTAAMFARTLPAVAPFFPFLMALVALSTAVTAMIPTKLRVGADGLQISWMRRQRFLAYGDITHIDPYEEPGMGKNRWAGLVVSLKSGEKVHLPIIAKQSSLRDQVYVIHERISEAIDTWSRGDGVADAALVRRSGREASDWVRALRSIGSGANADARTAPVLPEKLWRIVEDPAAPPDARAGAAVALGQTADEDARTRLRAAASATAAPKLRIAIETAAREGADDALVTALAELEADEAAAKKKA
ncbi:MAG: hypothetical protein U0441_12245 [Polyangiaceae bacterium]